MNGSELQAEIYALGRSGYRQGCGGTVSLPKGIIPVTETIRVGKPQDANTVSPSVTIRGTGAGSTLFHNGEPWGGTILDWQGEPGGIMMEVCGPFFQIRDVHFHMRNAAIGLRLTSNNKTSAITTGPVIECCSWSGHTPGGQREPNDAIAVEIAGENHNDQTDRVQIRDSHVIFTGTGVKQSSQQSALTLLQGLQFSTWHRGVDCTNGSMVVSCCAFNDRQESRDESYRAVLSRLHDTKRWHGGHQIHVTDCHFETSRGGVLEIDSPGMSFMSNFTENNVSMQRHEEGEILLCGSNALGPLFARGNTVGVSGPIQRQRPVVAGHVMWWDALNYIRPQVEADLVRR